MLQTTTNQQPNYSGHRKTGCDLFTAEFEINDIRPAARTILTKGQTQDEISQMAGVSISTRGRFISVAEKRSGALINDRSLYLFISSNTKASVDLAVQKIEEIIQMDNPALFRGFPVPSTASGQKFTASSSSSNNSVGMPLQVMTTMPPPIVSGGMAVTNTTNTVPATSTCVEKIFIGLDHAPPAFDLRSRIIGTGGANLNYIRTETRAMATLRGRGSLFIDPLLAMESPEPIHLYIETLRYEELQAAKQLARNLIETLQQELIQFQQVNPPQPPVNIQHYSAQTTVVQQPHIYTQHTMTQPPPPMISVPPPAIAPGGPGTTTLVQTTHPVPVQIHPQSLMQLQPPPGLPIPIKTITAPTAPPPHLSQPPPSIQHLQHPPTQTQIVVNQSVPIPIKTMVPMTVQTTPQPNYQYQYIHTTGQEATPAAATGPSGAVTIQHIYHQSPHPSLPPQHVQSIVQPATYMVPPPNLIQTTSQVPTSSIIYSTHPPPQLLQQPPNYSVAQTVHHQVITVQQPTQVLPTAEVALEEKTEELQKLEEFTADGQPRQTIVSCPMSGVPPIMSVPPPPAVQHITQFVPNSYATAQPPHLYGGQVGPSGWPNAAQPPGVHSAAAHGGGITYQQIQHPIMTPSTSMGMPVQYPQMPPAVMKINHPPPPFPANAVPGVHTTGPPPPQPVPFPMQQPPPPPPPSQPAQETVKPNLMRPGQKRKMMDDGGSNGPSNKNGHGERHMKMAGGPVDFVATSSTSGSRVALAKTSNTNSNDLNQDNYPGSGHRLDEMGHSVNQMTMPDIGDPHKPNCALQIDQQQQQTLQLEEGSYAGADLSHPPPPPGVRCNILGKPPPPLPAHLSRPESMSILANATQQGHRFANQW